MPKDDLEVRSYAYQCTDESGEVFVLSYFNGNQEVPDDTILHDGKTYQRVEHLRIDYDSIPAYQRDALAEMALDLTRQVMNDPELRVKCDQFVESAKHRKRKK